MRRKPDPYGRDAMRPYHIPLKGWWQVAERVWTESSRDNLSVVAAGCAFYALFAIFPALSALISLYGLTADPTTVERQFGALGLVLPAQAYDIVIAQIHRIAEASGKLLGWSFFVSLGLSLWSVMSLTQAMFAALNIAYEEPERRSLLLFYLSAFTFAVIGIIGGAVMLLAIVYVPILFAYAGYSEEFELLVRVARWPLLALLVLVLLAMLYRYGPCRRSAKWQWVSVGSVFATSIWLLASVGFSFYVANFGHYDKTYGSLGAVIVLLFWLYLSFYIVLLGAEINAELELQTARDTTRGRAKPMGKRGAFVADHVAGGPQGDKRPASPVKADPAAAKPGGASTPKAQLRFGPVLVSANGGAPARRRPRTARPRSRRLSTRYAPKRDRGLP
jgi:membrane protein